MSQDIESLKDLMTIDVQSRTRQLEFAREWFDEIESLKAFDEFSARIRERAKRLGFRIVDDDGESMVIWAISPSVGHAITVTGVWDADEGPSLACLFTGTRGRNRVALCRDESGVVVQEKFELF